MKVILFLALAHKQKIQIADRVIKKVKIDRFLSLTWLIWNLKKYKDIITICKQKYHK